MYKNQLQEFAQRSCINLPSYSSIREGPDHAPRFKAKVNCNGEIFESPKFCCTLRQAEHAAAEVALKMLSQRGPSRAVAAKVLDETGVYKNLLQETAHRAGMKLPVYTTVRTGPGYAPVFTCTVELSGMSFSGEPAKTKKQAQKSAAMAAWFSLKEMSHICSSSYHLSDLGRKDEQEQVIVARYLSSLRLPEMSISGQGEKGKLRKEIFRVKGNVIPCGVGSPSFRMKHQNSTYSYLPPEWFLYETCHRGVPQQSHFLALPSTSTSIPRPRFFPFIQSMMLRPDIGSIFWAREQEPIAAVPEPRPLFYLSNNLLPVPDRNDSRVTIEEIEENSPMQEEWLNKDVNPSCWRDNFLSSASGIPTLDVSNHPQSQHSSLEEELLQKETGERQVQSTNGTSKSIWPIKPNKEFSWLPPGFMCNRQSVTEAGEAWLQPQNIKSPGFLWSDVQHLHSKVASCPKDTRHSAGLTTVSGVTGRNGGAFSSASFRPVVSNRSLPVSTPRNAVFTGSTRPRVECKMKHSHPKPCASQMAPAVQIRTVMPVRSSPTRRMPSPSQEGTSSEGEIKSAEVTGKDISTASSEFCRLQI
nr:double-stranded RNA-binding protein 2-like [Coffea arabica]XP_027121131.1 double-stranded RNA-binding protein 2-like [Coffea arabica]